MTLETIVLPREAGHCEFAIIGLHGRNASGHAFLPLVRQLRFEATRWVLPSAPLYGDDPTVRWWYEHETQNIGEIAAARAALTDLIDAQVTDGIAPENIFLVGFSQGAVMAVDTAFRFPRRLGGVCALSGYVAHPALLASEIHPANKSLPVFLAHGVRDQILAIEVGRRNHSELAAMGIDVEYREYDTTHRISKAEATDIHAFLHRHMFGLDPGDPRLGYQAVEF